MAGFIELFLSIENFKSDIMKKSVSFILLMAGLFLASQVFAQVDSKTQGTSTTTEQKDNTNVSDKSVPPVQSSKTAPGSKSTGTTSTTNTKTGTGTTSKSGTSTVSSSKSSSVPAKMYDASGNLIYSIDQLGYVRNPKNRVFFQYTPAGEIIKKRVVIGTASNGIIRDKNGKEYARLAQGGKIVDANSKPIGAVKEDGTVINNKGAKIGSAPGVDKYVVIMVFFYHDVLENSASKPK